MASKKAVLFNLWGVVVSPRPAETFLKFEETHKLPSGFLEKLVTNEDSAMQRAERGKLSLSQMIPELDAECVSAASDQKVSLPAGFSVKSLLEELRDSTTVNKHILQTVATLRRQGLLTGVLANQWVDDSGCGDSSGRLLSLLGGHFDVVLQSCRTGLRVPEADLFISALKQLGVPPKQVHAHTHTHTHNLTCHHFSLVRSKNARISMEGKFQLKTHYQRRDITIEGYCHRRDITIEEILP
ncbi:bifunctional epoxide hydrolase 2-like [Oncorhynchus nerka]|uniref:bifunctional epoxide hydrolase 2-like n=1 Tax=Oncorhynchus nerka TaxID=8023 RepID=UPI0031B851A0